MQIKVNQVKKSYGRHASEFHALNGVSLNIESGESVAVTGKSGSGKSTLMHILALLDSPSSGEIFLEGRDVKDIKRKELDQLRNKHFGFVFQQFFMNPKETVLSNVMLPLKIAGIPSKKRKEMALDALRAVELEDKANNKATDLSGGQKQRVCIARAVVNEPNVVFADEPTGNLDSATSEKIEQLLFDLNKKKGITLVVITHDDELAARCGRQIKIKDGLIIQEAM